LLLAHSAFPTEAADAVFFGPDTYRFASVIEESLRQRFAPIRRAVDIGCGSGAGALLVARARPDAEVLAVDINPKALRM
ncbi:methyltransferase, partial [Mycobacterium avium]